MNAAQKALNEYEAKPVQELIYNAQQLVTNLCLHGPRRHWIMSVPVEPNDSDVVLSTALTKAGDRIAELEQEIAKLSQFAEPHARGALGRWLTADEMITEWRGSIESLESENDSLEQQLAETKRHNELLRRVARAVGDIGDNFLTKKRVLELAATYQAAFDGGALGVDDE